MGEDKLLASFIGLISHPTSVTIISPTRLVYSRSIGRDMVPALEKELAQSTGEYKYCLLIILNNFFRITDSLSIQGTKIVPVYIFNKDLLPECEEGILKTDSYSIKNGLIGIIRAYNYVPKSPEAQKIVDEYIAQRNSGTRAGGRG